MASKEEISIYLRYFALLREQSGKDEEILHTDAQTAGDLYARLQKVYGFTLPQQSLRVSINEEFSDWQTPLKSGDRVVFLPPVSGG